MPGGGKGGPPGPGGIIGGNPGPGGNGGRAAGSGKRLGCERSGLIVALTSTEPRRGRGSTESTRRTHAHGRTTHGRRTKMLRTETEASRRRAAARFIGSCDLVNDTLSLVVS